MIDTPELYEAFDAAVAAAATCRAAGMMCIDGSSAVTNLSRLEAELIDEKTRAKQRGSVDKEWFQKTVRWLIEWVPETELTLIAALGRIARAKPSTAP
jgi:hypothetical protein